MISVEQIEASRCPSCGVMPKKPCLDPNRGEPRRAKGFVVVGAVRFHAARWTAAADAYRRKAAHA